MIKSSLFLLRFSLSTSPRRFHVQQTFDDFLIVEREFVWRSSLRETRREIDAGLLLFFFPFSPLYNLARRESKCTLWPVGGCESSRLFKGCFLSSPHRTGANFPSGRRNRCMNRVDYNYGAESISWILPLKFLEQQTCCSLPRDDKCKRLFPSHDLPDICCRNNGSVLRYFITPVVHYFSAAKIFRLDKREWWSFLLDILKACNKIAW